MDFDVSDAFFSMSAGILLVSSFYFNYKACKCSHPPGHLPVLLNNMKTHPVQSTVIKFAMVTNK